MTALYEHLLVAFAACLLWLLCFGCASNQPASKRLAWDKGGESGGGYCIYQDGKVAGETSQRTWTIQRGHTYAVQSLETGLISTNFNYE